MFHHDEREYNVAASAAGRAARDKLQGIIDKGMASAQAVIEDIQSRVITDRVAPAPVVRLTVDEDDGTMGLSVGGVISPIHDHAFGQILSNAKVGKEFYNNMVAEASGGLWGKELIAHNVNQVLMHRTEQRNLIRGEGEAGLVKGFLSDKFRRLDCRPIVDSFIGACDRLGMVPLEGVASDTKMRLRAVLPYVFEPIDNEVMIFGAELGNSDYGDGGLVLNLWTMRVWCTNLATAEKCLRQVHIGGRLPDNVRFSDETYRKDAETTALAVRDMAADAVSPNRIHRILDAITTAGEEEIKGRDGLDKVLARVTKDKGELNMIKAIYESEDVQNLPAGNTMWRLSNAVSWFAKGQSIDADRKIRLQELAGQLVAGDTKTVNVKEV